jgi:hypothetical protein
MQLDDAAITAVSNQRLEVVDSAAIKYWRRNGSSTSKSDELRDKAASYYGVKFEPLMGHDVPICLVWGSGSFSTGYIELCKAKLLKEKLGWSPVNYVGVVSNNDNPEKCKARKVAGEFNLKAAAVDFPAWYRENIDKKSKSPTAETQFFYPPDSDYVPAEAELRQRFEIRQRFEREALVPEIKEKFGEIPFSASLRGYNFPIMTKEVARQVDDTHPADLSYVDIKGHAIYPGWQAGATAGMIQDGIPVYRSSLIAVQPATTFELAQSVDSGELLALAPGIRIRQEDTPAEAKDVQNALKQTDDYVLCALKATGLLRLWSLSTEPITVEYRTVDERSVEVKQRAVLVGNRLYCGRDAFGQNLSDFAELANL